MKDVEIALKETDCQGFQFKGMSEFATSFVFDFVEKCYCNFFHTKQREFSGKIWANASEYQNKEI